MNERIITKSSINIADGSRLDQLSHLDAEREVSCPDGLHKEEVLGLGNLIQLLSLRDSHGKSLFAENVLSGLECQHGVLEMVAMRGSDIDDIDIGVSNKLSI
jgi:hypothetical protein